jgi:hypothetical protein
MERIRTGRIPTPIRLTQPVRVYVAKIDSDEGTVITAMRFIHELLSSNENLYQSRFIEE